MIDINQYNNNVQDRLLELEIQFMEKHERNPMVPPQDMEIDAECYCILCHAALEEFAEQICLYFIDKLEDEFCNQHKFSWGTLGLVHFICSDKEETLSNQSMYSYLSRKINNEKSNIYNYALNNNHGVDVKYLVKLFVKIGLDIPNDAAQRSALEKLARYRGGWAHKASTRLKQQDSPSDIVSMVSEVYSLLNAIMQQAMAMKFNKI